MSPSPLLLAIHVTLALALTILVGVQSVQLGRLRHTTPVDPPPADRQARPLVAAIAAVPVLTLIVAATGGMLLKDGALGGPWIGAGVASAVAIGLTALWTLRTLRQRPARRWTSTAAAGVSAAQWGIPALTLAAAFLMADRPQNLPGAATPVLAATLAAAAAYTAALRSPTPRWNPK